MQRWLENNRVETIWLAGLAAPCGDWPAPLDEDDLFQLYALSRLLQVLQAGVHSSASESDEPSPALLSAAEYQDFTQQLGLRRVINSVYCPFFHEIVEIVPALDDDAPILLERAVWPTLMVGDLLMSRGGVRVSAGRRQLDKETVEQSPLYWAWIRNKRPCVDASQGRRINAQWSTRFCRDYLLAGTFLFNVDGEQNLAISGAHPLFAGDELEAEERLHLLLYRYPTQAMLKRGVELRPWCYEYRLPAQRGADGGLSLIPCLAFQPPHPQLDDPSATTSSASFMVNISIAIAILLLVAIVIVMLKPASTLVSVPAGESCITWCPQHGMQVRMERQQDTLYTGHGNRYVSSLNCYCELKP